MEKSKIVSIIDTCFDAVHESKLGPFVNSETGLKASAVAITVLENLIIKMVPAVYTQDLTGTLEVKEPNEGWKNGQ